MGRRASTDWVGLTAAAFNFGLGVALLALAIPRSIAAITVATGPPAVVMLRAGEQVPVAQLQKGEETLEAALRWARPSVNLAALSGIDYALALAEPEGSAERATALTRAEERTIEALKANPADGYSWVRLAVIRSIRNAPPREVVAPLIASLDMAPNERSLWPSRTVLLIYYWGDFTPDEIDIVRHQIRTIWEIPKFRILLLDAAMRFRQIGRLVGALTPDWEAIKELEAMQRAMAGP